MRAAIHTGEVAICTFGRIWALQCLAAENPCKSGVPLQFAGATSICHNVTSHTANSKEVQFEPLFLYAIDTFFKRLQFTCIAPLICGRFID